MKTRTLWAAGIMIMGFAGQALAAYSQAPSWMPMTMLTVDYDATTKALTVQDRATPVPLYANTLRIGNNAVTDVRDPYYANFDPSKPWYVAQGTIFSRQLGWDEGARAVHGNGTHDPGTLVPAVLEPIYGPNARIWIEEINSSPGLETYFADGMYGVGGEKKADYSTTDPLTGLPVPKIWVNNYYGIFGTDGSSQKWQWDGSMIHNLYTVEWTYSPDMANHVYFATYKVYVGDLAGNEILNLDGSSTATYETWKWIAPATNPVPEPSTFMLFGAGLASLVVLKRKRS